MSLPPSNDPTRIITRPGGRVYHLDLAPDEIADLIITVGDPARVERVSRHFDEIHLQRAFREFHTVTGRFGSTELTVLSTGMGSDNVDIVMNELELLANWDLQKQEVLPTKRQLKIVRLGTSGALQPELEVDSLLISRYACSVDVLHHFYPRFELDDDLLGALKAHALQMNLPPIHLFEAHSEWLSKLTGLSGIHIGFTFTASGFYAPQGRELWHSDKQERGLLDGLSRFSFKSHRITNVEMETAALYHLGRVFGHQVASVSCLLANRPKAKFSKDPQAAVDRMISSVLEQLV